MVEKKETLNKSQVSAFGIIGFNIILLFLLVLIYNQYKNDINYNNNIITINTTIKNYTIIISQCFDMNNNPYICYKGNIITNITCEFEKITDNIYENVKNWLTLYYPIGQQININYNVKTKKCDNYVNTNVEHAFIIFMDIFLI